MPANLNALIRYKTINNCLSGGRRKWSITELILACSEALAEYRGRYEQVSERTVRDDIRIMRSDILGFNAPISQEKGMYYYSNPVYSMMSIHITDSGLAGQIISLLQELRKEVKHPELEIVLGKLISLTAKKDIYDVEETDLMRETETSEACTPSAQTRYCMDEINEYDTELESNMKFRLSWELAEWGDVFKLL